jgi:TPR repeat protein
MLGDIFAQLDDDTRRGEQKAKEHFLRAGELGLGEGFSRAAEICIKNRNWGEAKQLYERAAEEVDVDGIRELACEARYGYFGLGTIIQEDQIRQPDLEGAARLFREGARLGDAFCCGGLARCYRLGRGSKSGQSFQMGKQAAEMGHVPSMFLCADCYCYGLGVDQSNEQAIYWYENYLALNDGERMHVSHDEIARYNLQGLRRARPGPFSSAH